MSKKRVWIVIISILLVIISIFLGGIYFLFLHRYKGKNVVNIWSESDEFLIENIVTINKKKDKDFVILNFADVQMGDLYNFFDMNTIHKELTYLVNKVKPDLITLTGDQTWSNENLISLKSLIRWLDEYKIFYAPVFGNHDYGNDGDNAVAGLNYCCDLYESGKYSLFKRGPTNINSLGNYVINIMEDGRIFKTLYMMDLGYNSQITDGQISWFKWNLEGIKNANGGVYSQSMMFMHKPIPQFAKAYSGYYYGYGNVEVIGNVYVHYSLYGGDDNGLFDYAKTRGLQDVVCGHQHCNSFTIKYQDVRLTFALKTGEIATYYQDEEVNLNGATAFVLSNNQTEINNISVDKDMFHLNGSTNFYDVENES